MAEGPFCHGLVICLQWTPALDCTCLWQAHDACLDCTGLWPAPVPHGTLTASPTGRVKGYPARDSACGGMLAEAAALLAAVTAVPFCHSQKHPCMCGMLSIKRCLYLVRGQLVDSCAVCTHLNLPAAGAGGRQHCRHGLCNSQHCKQPAHGGAVLPAARNLVANSVVGAPTKVTMLFLSALNLLS